MIVERIRACVIAVAALLGVSSALMLVGGVAEAHTTVDFTLPTDGAVVGEPVREITVAFRDPVRLIGPGFEVLDPQGNILTPFAATDDDRVFRLQLDPPIGGGEAAVRYEVRAEDGHTIAGGFRFTILADAPSPTTTAVTTTSTTTSTTVTTTTSTTITAPADPTTTAVISGPDADAGSGTSPESIEQDVVTGDDPASTDLLAPEGDRTGLYVAVAAIVVVLIGAVLVVRSRANTS